MSVCNTHGLYDAIIYIFNNGLLDYVTPVEELMTVLADAVRSQLPVNGQFKSKQIFLLPCGCEALISNYSSINRIRLITPSSEKPLAVEDIIIARVSEL